MFNKLIFTFFLLFTCLIITYPSKKENTNLFAYCYSLEKIIPKNSLEKSKNLSNNVKSFVKDITVFGTNKSKGALVNKLIDQYKTSKNSLIISVLPNKFYCLAGYWIENINPGTFESIFYEKSKQKIIEYNEIRTEVDKFIEDINLEYKSIKKEVNNLF